MQDSKKWDKADSWFIFVIIVVAILIEVLWPSDAVGAEYYYTPPSQPLVIEYSLTINGQQVNLTTTKCPEIIKTDNEPVDFTACPKGYLCKPSAANGMRTLRIEEERRYKKLMEVWGKSSTSKGGSK